MSGAAVPPRVDQERSNELGPVSEEDSMGTMGLVGSVEVSMELDAWDLMRKRSIVITPPVHQVFLYDIIHFVKICI